VKPGSKGKQPKQKNKQTMGRKVTEKRKRLPSPEPDPHTVVASASIVKKSKGKQSRKKNKQSPEPEPHTVVVLQQDTSPPPPHPPPGGHASGSTTPSGSKPVSKGKQPRKKNKQTIGSRKEIRLDKVTDLQIDEEWTCDSERINQKVKKFWAAWDLCHGDGDLLISYVDINQNQFLPVEFYVKFGGISLNSMNLLKHNIHKAKELCPPTYEIIKDSLRKELQIEIKERLDHP
jgi:hypothetical protein